MHFAFPKVIREKLLRSFDSAGSSKSIHNTQLQRRAWNLSEKSVRKTLVPSAVAATAKGLSVKDFGQVT